MGRACVILSDDWHPNDGVNWNSFSITVAERDASRIPEILDRNAHRAAEMGARARRVWEEQFSEQSRFIARLSNASNFAGGAQTAAGPDVYVF